MPAKLYNERSYSYAGDEISIKVPYALPSLHQTLLPMPTSQREY